jgi:hypothetical protein
MNEIFDIKNIFEFVRDPILPPLPELVLLYVPQKSSEKSLFDFQFKLRYDDFTLSAKKRNQLLMDSGVIYQFINFKN